MKTRRLSTLGFLMDRLNIPTVSLSRELHVDASLVSKWKSGDRYLNSRSIYFDQVICFLMDESEKSDHQILKKALSEIHPLEDIESLDCPEPFLRQLLSNPKLTVPDSRKTAYVESQHMAQISIFEQNSGRRKAALQLLDYAEKMPSPGQIIFIDSEEYDWLLEDETFSHNFIARLNTLLSLGFSAQFVIHFSSYRERFVRFFETCNILLFHRNVEWYYYEYYDENVFDFSLFVLDKSISLLGLSSNSSNSTTMIFTDTPSVLHHGMLAETVIARCQKLFINFEPDKCKDVVDFIRLIRKRGALYAYLPAPAFVSAKTDLLQEILQNNEIDPALAEQCIAVNKLMRDIVHTQFHGLEDYPERITQILQLEEMIKRAKSNPFISCSLTLLGGKQVKVTKHQYARCLRNLADALAKYPNLEIAFVSEKDHIPLPNIPEMNCWCKQNTWMVQMDQCGFRLSDEVSIVNAASVTLERCIRRIPPERKEKASVISFLLRFADELDSKC